MALVGAASSPPPYTIRLYDEAVHAEDHERLVWLLNLSAGFHPTEVYRRAMYTTSIVLFAVETATSTPVGLVVLEEQSDTIAKVSWLFVTLRHRGAGLGDRLLSEAVKAAATRAAAQCIDAFRTDATHRFFTRFGFATSKLLKHTVTLPLTKESRRSWLPICEKCPPAVASGAVFLRMATPADRKEWCALVLDACNYDMGGGEMVQITLDAAFRCVAVSRDEGSLVGLISMSSTGWIPFLCCRENSRGGGIGSLLLSAAVEWLRRSSATAPQRPGARPVAIETSLSPLRKRNVTYYERKGYALETALKNNLAFEKNKLTMSRDVDPLLCVLPPPYVRLEDLVADVFAPVPAPEPEPDFGALLTQLARVGRRTRQTRDDGKTSPAEIVQPPDDIEDASAAPKKHRAEVATAKA